MRLLPELAAWFIEEWEPYYGPDGPGDAFADLAEARSADVIPICLVALDDDGRPLGTVALKERSVSHQHLSPWVVALLVRPEARGRGVGSRLLASVEAEARRLGFERIYVATDTATSLLERRGWRAFDTAPTLRGDVGVFALELGS